MQKYYFHEGAGGEGWIDTTTPDAFSGSVSEGPYYLSRVADARIAELERALKSCALVIGRELKHVDETTAIALQALAEADKALSL